MPRLVTLIVPARVVDRNPVIPKGGGTWSPFEPNLNVHVGLVHIVQVIEDDIALGLVEADYPGSHCSVHPQGFPPRGGMDPYERMGALDELGTCLRVLSVEVLMRGRKYRVSAVDDLAELW